MKKNNYTELTEKQELTIYGIVAFLLCTMIVLDYISCFTN